MVPGEERTFPAVCRPALPTPVATQMTNVTASLCSSRHTDTQYSLNCHVKELVNLHFSFLVSLGNDHIVSWAPRCTRLSRYTPKLGGAFAEMCLHTTWSLQWKSGQSYQVLFVDGSCKQFRTRVAVCVSLCVHACLCLWVCVSEYK